MSRTEEVVAIGETISNGGIVSAGNSSVFTVSKTKIGQSKLEISIYCCDGADNEQARHQALRSRFQTGIRV